MILVVPKAKSFKILKSASRKTLTIPLVVPTSSSRNNLRSWEQIRP
jgi:hypothetical protein